MRLFGVHKTSTIRNLAYAARKLNSGRWARIAYYERGLGWTQFPNRKSPIVGHRKLRVALIAWKLKA